ncbi:hypothetical protein SprV_0100500400 [Sparganum proliferum]
MKDDNGVEITENSEKTELLGQYFASVFTRETEFRSHSASNAVETACPVLDSTLFPTAVVERELKNLKEAKCSVPDNIPAKFLKELANELSKPLAHIFRSSFELGRLPSEWKTANIFQIYKGGARTNANNYRPVSLTCICCKIMEAIVKKATMEFLEQGHLLSDLQHGFRQNRSCLSSLLLSTEQWTRALDEDGRVDVVYTDFKKAFDSVPHKRLIYKLSEIGIRGRLLTWKTDFLTGRSQTVCIEASTSTPTPVLSGVPQGSVLGPLLFLVYINDCVDDLGCSAILFADDVKLWRPIKSDADRQLRGDLIQTYRIVRNRECALDLDEFFELAGTDRLRGHPFKLQRITEVFELASRMRQARDRQGESLALSDSNPSKSVANVFRHRSSSKRDHELPPLPNNNKVLLIEDADKAELFSAFFAKHPNTESEPVPFFRTLTDRTVSTIDVSSDLIK